MADNAHSVDKPACIYCGLWVDLEDGKNLVRMDVDGNLMAAHPQCLAVHRGTDDRR